MPTFKIHLRRHDAVDPDELGMDFRDLHHAYLETCKAIPDAARDLLITGQDPMACAYIICDADGRSLLEVPFAEALSPSEWRLRRAGRRPYGGVRSQRTRDDLALSSFRRMFSWVNAGCVLMTPELDVVEMNDFGARHGHVDAEAIRGKSVLDVFVDLKGEAKLNFTKFMMLARTAAVSEIVNLPYYVLDEAGRTANGWWNARTWPVFDDDSCLLGLVAWAEPFTRPAGEGSTLVRVATGLAR